MARPRAKELTERELLEAVGTDLPELVPHREIDLRSTRTESEPKE